MTETTGALPSVMLIITQDTKEEEARFVRAALEAAGVRVVHLDPSVRRTLGGAEISPEDVAAGAGMTIEEVRALGHEGKCQDAMIRGSIAAAHAWNATMRVPPVPAKPLGAPLPGSTQPA